MPAALRTARLELLPMTGEVVEAVLLGRRDAAESLVNARMPERWPNRELIERAFAVSLDDVRSRPERLWGARVLIAGASSAERHVVGSVLFRGEPDDEGVSEIAYGVEDGSQGRGFATEAVGACVSWALDQPGARAVRAVTFAWHRASIRVLQKVGMAPAGVRDHETMGEMIVYELRRGPLSSPA